jgi:peptide/nickel transport system substrate-binding protein
VLAKYTPNQKLVLDRNPNYWGGPVPLDHVRFTWPTSGDAARLQALDAGDVDVAAMSEALVVQNAAGKYPGFQEIRAVSSIIVMNTRQGTRTADPRVRKAVVYAIDPQVMNMRVWDGKGLTTKDMFPEGTRWHGTVSGLPADAQQAKHWWSG